MRQIKYVQTVYIIIGQNRFYKQVKRNQVGYYHFTRLQQRIQRTQALSQQGQGKRLTYYPKPLEKIVNNHYNYHRTHQKAEELMTDFKERDSVQSFHQPSTVLSAHRNSPHNYTHLIGVIRGEWSMDDHMPPRICYATGIALSKRVVLTCLHAVCYQHGNKPRVCHSISFIPHDEHNPPSCNKRIYKSTSKNFIKLLEIPKISPSKNATGLALVYLSEDLECQDFLEIGLEDRSIIGVGSVITASGFPSKTYDREGNLQNIVIERESLEGKIFQINGDKMQHNLMVKTGHGGSGILHQDVNTGKITIIGMHIEPGKPRSFGVLLNQSVLKKLAKLQTELGLEHKQYDMSIRLPKQIKRQVFQSLNQEERLQILFTAPLFMTKWICDHNEQFQEQCQSENSFIDFSYREFDRETRSQWSSLEDLDSSFDEKDIQRGIDHEANQKGKNFSQTRDTNQHQTSQIFDGDLNQKYAFIGPLICVMKNEESFTSTAFLISEDKLVTCTHAFVNSDKVYAAYKIIFIPNCRNSLKEFRYISEICQQDIYSSDPDPTFSSRHISNEFALLTLSKPIRLGVPFLKCYSPTLKDLKGNKMIKIVGYPNPQIYYSFIANDIVNQDKTKIVRTIYRGKIENFIKEQCKLQYRISTQRGVSGAPIIMTMIDEFGDRRDVILGIHTHGDKGDPGLCSMGLLLNDQMVRRIQQQSSMKTGRILSLG